MADQEDGEDKMDGAGRTDGVQVDGFVKDVNVGGFEGDRPEMGEDVSSRVVKDNEDTVGKDVTELMGAEGGLADAGYGLEGELEDESVKVEGEAVLEDDEVYFEGNATEMMKDEDGMDEDDDAV